MISTIGHASNVPPCVLVRNSVLHNAVVLRASPLATNEVVLMQFSAKANKPYLDGGAGARNSRVFNANTQRLSSMARPLLPTRNEEVGDDPR